jgi:STE20-related kinase adapter protein alpha
MLSQDLRGYSYSSDIYSLGLTVCELANAEQPYEGYQPTLMMVEKLKGRVPFLVDASKPLPDGETFNMNFQVELLNLTDESSYKLFVEDILLLN